MDGVSALVIGMQRSEATLDYAARRTASDDLPTATSSAPGVTNNPSATTDVDVADQLTTMMVAADSHHLSATAIKVALSTYQDILNTAHVNAETDGPTSGVDESR
jgi:hypothetical protein